MPKNIILRNKQKYCNIFSQRYYLLSFNPLQKISIPLSIVYVSF